MVQNDVEISVDFPLLVQNDVEISVDFPFNLSGNDAKLSEQESRIYSSGE